MNNMINWVKEKVKSLFGEVDQVKVEDKGQPPLMVRMDILDHKVSNEKREEIRKQMMEHSNTSSFNVKGDILNNRDFDNLEQVFNSLPLSRISDECKSLIIDIVNRDIRVQSSKLANQLGFGDEYDNATPDDQHQIILREFDKLNDETNKNLNK